MCGMQGTFLRCKTCLLSEIYKRRLVLQAMVLIHNYCTEIVGLNQIKSVFGPEYEHVISLEGYDRISKYYLRADDYDTDEEDENID